MINPRKSRSQHQLSEDSQNFWTPLMRAFPAFETPLNPEHCSMNPLSQKKQTNPPPPLYSDISCHYWLAHTPREYPKELSLHYVHLAHEIHTKFLCSCFHSYMYLVRNKQSLQISSMLTYLHNISLPNNYFSA